MMTFEMVSSLIAFAFVMSITPGPNNLMLMASGTNFGFIRTLPHMLGVSIGFMFMMSLVGAGVMKVFEAYPLTYTILRVVSFAYLLYLAWKIATAKSISKNGRADQAPESKPFTFVQAALFQWVNPKAWTMAVVAVATYVPKEAGLYGIVLTTLIFGSMNFPSVSCWALLGTQIRRFLGTPRRLQVFNISAACLLVLSLLPVMLKAG